MLGRLFKQNQPGSNVHNSNGNVGYSGAAGANNSYANSYGTNHQPKNGPISNLNTNSYQNVNTFEDSYSREILYGTSDVLQLKPYQLNNKFFRIIISQDGGNLRSKQVLYDSAAQNNDNPGIAARPPSVSRNNSSNNVNSKNILTSKIYHNASELNDYMFGCGLPSNETYSTTKIHILPTLNNLTYGSNHSILITRLFLISDNSEILTFNDNFEVQWKPCPALPIKETLIKNYAFSIAHCKTASTDSSSANKLTNGINSRFSIGLIIPLESVDDHLNDVIFNNWDEISHYLIVLQKLIIKKLMLTLNNSVNDLSLSNLSSQNNSPNHSHIHCPYIVNKRIQFPSYILQNELDLNNQLIKLIKLMHYNTNVPKLINSNSLMRSSMNNCALKMNPMLFNWISEVLNWLQFKDGRSMNNDIIPQLHSSFNSNSQFQYSNATSTSNAPSIQSSPSINNFSPSQNTDTTITKTFLASLLALLIPLRKLLTIKPFSNSNDNSNTREITRVIVITGNPVVAKKLIFIINGLIPDNEMLSILDDQEDENSDVSESSNESKPVQHSIDKILENKSEEFIDENAFSNDSLSTPSSVQQKLFSSTGDMNHVNVLGESKPVLTIPIPIKSSTASSYSSSDNSPLTHTTSVKGWEIPHKSSASTTTTPFKSRVEVGTCVIPIAQKTPARSSLSKSSSMAYLSSSLTSSLSSSASNYSLSKLGGSFMEKWKNSFSNNQHTNTNVNPSNNQTNILLVFNPENHEFLPPTLGNISKRNSVHSLRTPSPVVEMDDNLLFHNNSNIGNIPHNSSSSTKMSRAQSMFDLYNNNNNKKNSIGMIQEEGKQLHMEIKRSNTSIYTSSLHDSCKVRDINDFNINIIRTKCSVIMKSNILLGDPVDKTLNISTVTEKSGDESSSYYEDESTITSSKVNDIAPLIKHRPLFPNVAFAEEFRPEFILQSCPINSKLESQVMTSMKNDLLFYQNNCQFDNVTSRSVLISLRAREIKMIEMNVGEAANGRKESSSNDQSYSNSGTPLDSHQESHKPSLQSALTKGIRNNKDQNETRRSSTTSNGTASYRTIIKKIFSPTRNSGDKEVIHVIENTLDEINRLFQSYSNNQRNDTMSQEFNEKLTMLMSNILA